MNTDNSISISGLDWLRIVVMAVISVIYLSLFVWLGLLVSSRLSRSAMSLVILLLIWVILAMVIPVGISTLVGRSHSLPTAEEFSAQINAVRNDFWRRLRSQGLMGELPEKKHPPTAATLKWADSLSEVYDTIAQLREDHLACQLAQVRRVRTFAHISPAVAYQHALEALAGTGLARHERFIAQVRRYREEFLQFVREEDRKDRNSLHVYFLPETISHKAVDFQNVPRFVERISFGTELQSALWNITLLVGGNVVLLLAAATVFLHADAR